MIPVDYFSQRGVLQFRREFLSAAECRRLIGYLEKVPSRDARVFGEKSAKEQGYRDTRNLLVAPNLREELSARLLQLAPELNAQFGTRVNCLQSLQFYCYDPGGYLSKHHDWIDEMDGTVLRRDISLVLFLNGPGEPQAGGFSGGELVFYLPQRNGMTVGLPLKVEPGLLICFNPRLLHEVKIVTAGSRYSIVAWYAHDPGQALPKR